MRVRRRKHNKTALWIIGVGAGLAITAGVVAVLRSSRRGQLALRREMRSLEGRVLRALRQHATAGTQSIDVAAVGAGVIELSGFVDNEQVAHEVVELVDRVAGVHAVFNRMDVRSVESRLQKNRGRAETGAGTRWYGGSVGIGRRRQSPSTDPQRRDDHAELLVKALQPNRDDVLSEVEEMEGNGVQIGISRAGPLTTDVPPRRPE
ncbi:MAG TPA: BON domain-containing protein [Longimicrobiales bacterium]